MILIFVRFPKIGGAMLFAGLVGAGLGWLVGAVVGGFRYVPSAGQIPPSGRVREPLRNYLSWSRLPMLVGTLIGSVSGTLGAALFG